MRCLAICDRALYQLQTCYSTRAEVEHCSLHYTKVQCTAVRSGTVHNHKWPSSDLVEAYMLLDAFVTMGQAHAPWLMRAVVPVLEECAGR